MKQPDQMRRSPYEENPIRDQPVSLDASWREIVEQPQAIGMAQILLGQALTAAALLVETLKINDSISLQICGRGAIHLLVVEATSDRSIRGIARQSCELSGHEALPKYSGQKSSSLLTMVTRNRIKALLHRAAITWLKHYRLILHNPSSCQHNSGLPATRKPTAVYYCKSYSMPQKTLLPGLTTD